MVRPGKIFSRRLPVRTWLLALLTWMAAGPLQAQEADTTRYRAGGFYVGLLAGYNQTTIRNQGVNAVAGLLNSAGKGQSVMVEVGYSFTRHFAVSSGARFSTFNGTVSLNNYQDKFNTSDSEGEVYERRVTGLGINEEQHISFVGVPMALDFRIPLRAGIGFFIRPGVIVELPVKTSYHSTGTFTYKGYYQKYNVVLENLPAYGFPTNAAVVSDGTVGIKNPCLEAMASAGLDFRLSRRLQGTIAWCYQESLSGIQSGEQPAAFQLSPDATLVKSLTGGSTNTVVQSSGVTFSVRYRLSGH